MAMHGCAQVPGPYDCTNLSDSYVHIEVYEGAAQNAIGARPSLKVYVGTIAPNTVWSSAETQPSHTDAVFGPTIVLVRSAGQTEPQAYMMNTESRESLVIDNKAECIVLSRVIDGRPVVQEAIEDDRRQEILIKLRR